MSFLVTKPWKLLSHQAVCLMLLNSTKIAEEPVFCVKIGEWETSRQILKARTAQESRRILAVTLF
jgi:hypothetical protein